MRRYRCYRVDGFPRVEVVDDKAGQWALMISPSRKVADYYHDFDWGNTGPAVDQLALAISLEFAADKQQAFKLADLIKWSFLAQASRIGTTITSDQVCQLIKSL